MDSLFSVLVTGATGQQGGAVARHLLRRGYHVLALTRRMDSPAARALQAQGAELVQGDFEDRDSLEAAVRRADMLFAMATPFQAGIEAEVRHGLHLIDAARHVGVKHFVYSSVAGADRRTGIPHFDSKHEVERYLRHANLPYTIIAPTFFMENFTGSMFREGLQAGQLALPLAPSHGLQLVSVEDLGAFVGRVLAFPEDFLGERIEVASDEVTGHQAADLLSYVSGHRIHYHQLPLELVREQSEDLARMYEWIDRVGYHADILTLRHEFPDVGWHTFEEWARGQEWHFIGAAARLDMGSSAH
ncbi:NmrA/HSCARG family protein [Hyalangium rubrum]|uniref:NmrA/HSCARG family protein n=1 Tax=Hyalangium rubrum TaxID=3103134 RepID=A0ABU5HA16_9BACT|nr:NmrA/HSCARG family protein [Hyalangium sp. s54d21]MDY7230086.1 NmrA/HSCARG family protein [Hyalangium sp. s54d21]